jgi:hypothetical protein
VKYVVSVSEGDLPLPSVWVRLDLIIIVVNQRVFLAERACSRCNLINHSCKDKGIRLSKVIFCIIY